MSCPAIDGLLWCDEEDGHGGCHWNELMEVNFTGDHSGFPYLSHMNSWPTDGGVELTEDEKLLDKDLDLADSSVTAPKV